MNLDRLTFDSREPFEAIVARVEVEKNREVYVKNKDSANYRAK